MRKRRSVKSETWKKAKLKPHQWLVGTKAKILPGKPRVPTYQVIVADGGQVPTRALPMWFSKYWDFAKIGISRIFLDFRVLFWIQVPIRVSQISKIFGPTVFCVLLNERKLVRPSLGIFRDIFHVGQASKAHWSGG